MARAQQVLYVHRTISRKSANRGLNGEPVGECEPIKQREYGFRRGHRIIYLAMGPVNGESWNPEFLESWNRVGCTYVIYETAEVSAVGRRIFEIPPTHKTTRFERLFPSSSTMRVFRSTGYRCGVINPAVKPSTIDPHYIIRFVCTTGPLLLLDHVLCESGDYEIASSAIVLVRTFSHDRNHGKCECDFVGDSRHALSFIILVNSYSRQHFQLKL